MKRIPVCYCGNSKIFGGVFLSVLSIIKHTDAALDIILLTMDLSDRDPRFLPFSKEQGALMEKALKAKNSDSSVRIIDVTHLQKEFFDGGKNQNNGYTPYASIRLFLDLLDVPDKLIYLDADVMCCSDIAEYYDTDISNYEFAATLDVLGHHFFPGRYCNSGTLLLNIPYIRKTELFKKARKRIREKKMLLPDQSAINMLAKSKLVLPYRFNEQRAIKPDTVLKHFCMWPKINGFKLIKQNVKQWHIDDVHNVLGIHLFDSIYDEYNTIIREEKADFLIKM